MTKSEKIRSAPALLAELVGRTISAASVQPLEPRQSRLLPAAMTVQCSDGAALFVVLNHGEAHVRSADGYVARTWTSLLGEDDAPPVNVTVAQSEHDGGTLTFTPLRRGVQVDRPVVQLEVKPGESLHEVAERAAALLNERRGQRWAVEPSAGTRIEEHSGSCYALLPDEAYLGQVEQPALGASTKIDLNELERKATDYRATIFEVVERDVERGELSSGSAQKASDMRSRDARIQLALIARIRELECALYSTIERNYTAKTIMGILEKGVVLPSSIFCECPPDGTRRWDGYGRCHACGRAYEQGAVRP